MIRIVLLDGSERLDRDTMAATAEADLVIDLDGVVLRSRGDHPSRVNIAELRRALSTQARPRKAPDVCAALRPDLRPVARFLLIMGWRAAEACCLKWADVDMDEGFATWRGKGGAVAAAAILQEHVIRGMDRRAATPFEADNYLKAARGLFAWAAAAGHIAADPTIGVKAIKAKTQGFHSWTESEIDQFEARWPIGTRERLAMALFLYSGLRRGDVAALGRQHIKDGRIVLRTEKTGALLTLPILPQLQGVIDATPLGDLALIANAKTRRGMSKEGLGNWFSAACRAAGVPGSAHGLRKAGARRAAENGATQAQLKAIYGWTSDAVAAIYIRDADRARLAQDGMAMLTKTGTSIPEPKDKVRAARRKSK